MREVRVRYMGPDGGRNHDVAAATRESAVMVRGSTYRVPRELADRLLATHDFVTVSPARRAAHPKED
ncbi:MAG TPA: hypothetical protein VIK83_03390 [Coriobacteriia bacterium]